MAADALKRKIRTPNNNGRFGTPSRRLGSTGIPIALEVAMKRWMGLFALAAAIAAPPQNIPREAQNAAAAFFALFPGAVLENVRPSGSSDPGGAVAGERMYWIFRFRAGGRSAEASLAADGLLIRIAAPVESGDVPPAIVKTMKDAWPSMALDGIRRIEIRATLRFIVADKPRAIYGLSLIKDGRPVKLDIRSDGSLQTPAASFSNILDDVVADSFFPPTAVQDKEIPIPAEAVRAVEAVKQEYPGAVVQAIDPTVFNDKSGTIETVFFDVEIGWRGKPKTVPVTPEGILLYTVTPLSAGDLPPVIAEAAARACPGGTISEAVRQEVRAVPRFVAIAAPRFVYSADVIDRGRRDTVIIAPDGTRIVPVRPWHWRGR
jgi:hypothetical protein